MARPLGAPGALIASGPVAGTLEGVSEVHRSEQRASVVEDLDADDRRWLEERLVEYRELLEYLHDH